MNEKKNKGIMYSITKEPQKKTKKEKQQQRTLTAQNNTAHMGDDGV